MLLFSSRAGTLADKTQDPRGLRGFSNLDLQKVFVCSYFLKSVTSTRVTSLHEYITHRCSMDACPLRGRSAGSKRYESSISIVT